ncbi:MAG TPA: three-Cys-motif partner protein TcmP [Chloroflexota bacterium]|nr:three-Cys-motif partner protein TcmP [Chloroflexota bacterium]HUM70891.1 three-Cys-motif partner protein TcmP [Chloroflexota bacterium]
MPEIGNAEFFIELKDWSERKLNILEKYLDPFTKILGSQYSSKYVYYIDAFAGAGLYGDGSKGSAVRAAELAQQYERDNKPYRLRCINIEADQRNFKDLQKNTAQFENLVINLQGTFVDNVAQVLNQISNSPALCFLDPFGIKGIDAWEVIQQIIHRGSPTDFWIRFDYITLSRLAGFYESDAIMANKNLDTLCATYGINDKDLLFGLISGDTIEEKRINAVNLYLRRLTEEFQKTRRKGFAAYYPIKSITGQDKYFLVFASGHPKGAIIASELICGIEENYQREIEEFRASKPRQLSIFPEPTEEEIFQDKVARLQNSIVNSCSNERLSREEIYERILPDWFGKIRATHMTKAIKGLQKRGIITTSTGTAGDRKSIFTFK